MVGSLPAVVKLCLKLWSRMLWSSALGLGLGFGGLGCGSHGIWAANAPIQCYPRYIASACSALAKPVGATFFPRLYIAGEEKMFAPTAY